MHFLRLFLAFIQKLCLLSFHFSKVNKRGAGIRAGGWKNFQKLISGGGGTIFRFSRVLDFGLVCYLSLCSECQCESCPGETEIS